MAYDTPTTRSASVATSVMPPHSSVVRISHAGTLSPSAKRRLAARRSAAAGRSSGRARRIDCMAGTLAPAAPRRYLPPDMRREDNAVLPSDLPREVPDQPPDADARSPESRGGTMSETFRVVDEIPLPERGAPVTGRATREEAYPIVVCRAFDAAIAQLIEWAADRAVAVITDEVVEALYGSMLIRGLRDAGKQPLVRVLPEGERSKSLDEAVGAWHWLAGSEMARRDVLITFGGGVIADLGGWVASGYMRGIPYVNVPTTLLAQVDGALGGKVAANHPVAKNLIGGFHSPVGVVANVGFLRSTSSRHLRAGLAEAIKKAMIASPEYWTFIEESAELLLARDLDALERLVHCAAAIK